jgi:hypothetical protein
MKDVIHIEILSDGTIKTETDAVSPAAHQSAENFLRECFRLAGGTSTLTYKKPHRLTEHSHGTHVHTH